MEKVFIIGLAIVAFGVGFLLHGWVSPSPSLFDISSSSRSLSSSSPSQFERFDSAVSSGYTDVAHNSIPTKMSLQGKVTDFNNTPIDYTFSYYPRCEYCNSWSILWLFTIE